MSDSKRINLDTNIMLRLIIDDDESPEQHVKARKEVRNLWYDGGEIFVTTNVLVEACWVLRRRYKLPKAAITEFVESLLGLNSTQLEYRNEIILALSSYRNGQGDFPDYLIGHISKAHDCDITWTFDKALSEADLFEVKQSY